MTTPRTLLKAWQLKPRKNLGQNFLVDSQLALTIVKAARLDNTATVLEIGAGLGALTVPAAKAAKRILAIEKDRHLARLLQTELALWKLENVEIWPKDVFDCDFTSIAQAEKCSFTILGNLPYNISSQVVVKLIDQRKVISSAVLMFQKELAQRLASPPGSKRYGRLSVLLQYCADIETVCLAPPSAFYPRPKVDSMVVRITFRNPPEPYPTDEKLLRRLVQAAFGRRRKTLKNSLAAGLPELDNINARKLLVDAGIDPHRRAETLSVNEFVRLTNLFQKTFQGNIS